MSKAKLLLIVTLVVFAFVVAGCGANVVATVNGKTITYRQLDEEVNSVKKMLERQGTDFSSQEGKNMLAVLRPKVMEQMINEELLLQEAKNLKVEPPAEQIEEEIKNFRQQFESETKYKQFLTDNEFSGSKLKDLIRKHLTIQAVQEEALKDREEISEAAAKDFYEKNKDIFTLPEQCQIRQILFPVAGEEQKALEQAKIEAMNVLKRIKQGEDFAAVAKEKAGNTDSPGELSTFSRGEIDPELEKVTYSLKPGEVSPEPVKTEYGYHLIKLEKITPAQIKPFSDVQGDILAYLDEQAREKIFTDYLESLKSKATIINKLINEVPGSK